MTAATLAPRRPPTLHTPTDGHSAHCFACWQQRLQKRIEQRRLLRQAEEAQARAEEQLKTCPRHEEQQRTWDVLTAMIFVREARRQLQGALS